MFGRPLAIAPHHFNTQLPSYCPPKLDKTGRFCIPNVAPLRLAFILGETMENVVSSRPVMYESLKRNDQLLVQWLETLPERSIITPLCKASYPTRLGSPSTDRTLGSGSGRLSKSRTIAIDPQRRCWLWRNRRVLATWTETLSNCRQSAWRPQLETFPHLLGLDVLHVPIDP